MKIEIRNQCADSQSYRAQRVKSLFNVTSGANFSRDFELSLDGDWQIGVIVGPSGSGKTSIGRALQWEPWAPAWDDGPIIDQIGDDFDGATNALASVGLGDVPAWLRPHRVLSNGERFRADLARCLAAGPDQVILDEFSSVVDRQIAQIGAGAFAKGWRRRTGKAILITCHYDILDWVEPDWVLDTAPGADGWRWTKGCLHRPRLEVAIHETGWSWWPYFEDHHYLKAGPMAFATAYVGFIGQTPVAHLGMGGKDAGGKREARACRMVVLPEWQGAGIGMRMLNTLAQRELDGWGYIGAKVTTQFHTAHPALVAALKRDNRWEQISANIGGQLRRQSQASLKRDWRHNPRGGGFGGHLRAVTGWRFFG